MDFSRFSVPFCDTNFYEFRILKVDFDGTKLESFEWEWRKFEDESKVNVKNMENEAQWVDEFVNSQC